MIVIVYFLIKVSAKTGEGVNGLLKLIAQKVLDQPRAPTGHKSASSSRKRGERVPLLIESGDTESDGFVTTKDVSKDCNCCILMW